MQRGLGVLAGEKRKASIFCRGGERASPRARRTKILLINKRLLSSEKKPLSQQTKETDLNSTEKAAIACMARGLLTVLIPHPGGKKGGGSICGNGGER